MTPLPIPALQSGGTTPRRYTPRVQRSQTEVERSKQWQQSLDARRSQGLGFHQQSITEAPDVLTVSLKTSKGKDSGTDSNVYVRIHGDKSVSDEIFLEDLTNPQPFMTPGRTSTFHTKLRLSTLGDILAMEVRLDETTGIEPSWHLRKVKVKAATGELWEFKCDEWLSKTHGAGHVAVELDMPLTYDILPYRQLGGRVVVEGTDTLIKFRKSSLHFTKYTDIDWMMSLLIFFSVAVNVFRSEFVNDWTRIDDQSDTAYEAGVILLPILLVIDLVLLLGFLGELLVRLTVKMSGKYNVFAYTLKSYNRRHRKLGQRQFEKHRIRPSKPWWATWLRIDPHTNQLKKEFQQNVEADLAVQRKVPFNYLSDDYFFLIVLEVAIVVVSTILVTVYIITSAQEGGLSRGHDKNSEVDSHLEGLDTINSVLRMLRLLRVMLRIKKLRSLLSSLGHAAVGVSWILMMVMLVTYLFAEIGTIVFSVDIDDPDLKDGYYIDRSSHDIVASPTGAYQGRPLLYPSYIDQPPACANATGEGARVCTLVDADTVLELYGYWGSLFSAMSTLTFNVALQDDLNAMMGVSRGSAGRGVKGFFDPPGHLLTSFHTILRERFGGQLPSSPSF
jgi:hypothetical protein